MQFYFIRHGQSTNNVLWDSTGSETGRSEDAALTDLGWRQAEVLGEFLRRRNPVQTADVRDLQNLSGFGITHLYCSLMVRSIETGTVVAGALDLRLVAWQDVHETGGIFLSDEQSGERIGQPGKPRSYFEQHYPDLVLPNTLDESGWWNRPFESTEEIEARAQRVLKELLERHDAMDRVAVISHGGFYNYLMTALLNMPSREGFWMFMHNAAITRIDFGEDRTDVVYSNRVDFMPRGLVS